MENLGYCLLFYGLSNLYSALYLTVYKYLCKCISRTSEFNMNYMNYAIVSFYFAI